MTDQPTACRTTRHCADHGFCHRCTPSLDDAVRHLVKAISAAGIDDERKGAVYAQLAATVRDAARTASGQQPVRDCPSCGHCKGSGADPAEMRQAIAHAIHRYDNHHALSGNDMPSAYHYGEADAVLAVLAAPAVGQPAEAQATDRAAVLHEAIEAAEGELLHDDTRTPEDEAYNQGVRDAAAAIARLTVEDDTR